MQAVGLPPTPRSPESPNPLRRGSSPRSDGLQSTFSQYVGSPLGAAAHPELWLLRKFGPLADEQVEIGPLIGQGGYGRVYKGAHNCFLLSRLLLSRLLLPVVTFAPSQVAQTRIVGISRPLVWDRDSGPRS